MEERLHIVKLPGKDAFSRSASGCGWIVGVSNLFPCLSMSWEVKPLLLVVIWVLEVYHGKWYSCLQKSCHCFRSAKNVFIWNSSREASYWQTERRSQIEIPPICGNPENTSWSEVILPLYILCLRCLLLLRLRGDKLLATILFFSDNTWQYSSFLITLDCRPCIIIVHDELYVLHQESKTPVAEHSSGLGTASRWWEIEFFSSPYCWAGLGKGSYLEQCYFCLQPLLHPGPNLSMDQCLLQYR